MIRKFLPSDNVDERLVCRDGNFSVFDGRLLDAAGFLVDSQWTALKSFDEIVKAGNAIIVAEGGMGKSHVQRLFCESQQDPSLVKRIELFSYANNEQSLTDAIIAAAHNKEYLFLDGLDEAENLAGALSRVLAEVDGHAHIVLASRGISKLGALSERLRWPMFSLLPYSRENVRELCNEADIDADAFMRMIDGQNLGGFCSRPLGYMMLIEKYKKTALTGVTTESLWCNLIETLCDENQESTSRKLVSNEKVIPIHEGIRIATIVALSLKLSGCTLIARIENRRPRADAFDFSKLFADKDTRESFNALLLRSLFLYVDKGCYRFAHSSYMDFLAAQGMMEYFDEKEWKHLVFSPEGLPYPQWECVVPWLAARNDAILEKLKRSRPDLLLGTDALLNKLGEDEICQAILDYGDQIPSTVRNNPAVQSRYYALNTTKCAKVIRQVMKTATSDVVVDTAMDIIRRARLVEVADLLVDVFCDATRNRLLRISAGCALIELANKTQRKKCKKVLRESMDNRLKSLVLRMTWPDFLSVEELLPLLGEQHEEQADSFSNWIEFGGFVASLPLLPSKDKFKLLDWAVSSIREHDGTHDCIADARRSVFLHCWKEERSPKFVPLLAKGIVAYNALCQSPFAGDNFEWHDSNHIFSYQDYRNDSLRRREVAKCIVEEPVFPIDAVSGCWIQLLGVEDGDFALSSLESTPNPVIRERWGRCLRWIGYVQLPEKAALWDQLHKEFPTVFSCEANEALAEAKKYGQELASQQQRFKRERESREEENKRILAQNVVWAHKILGAGKAQGRFVPLMNVLGQQMQWDSATSHLDYMASAFWHSLSESERQNLAGAAYDFLLKCDGPWSDNHSGYPIYAQALCLLFSHGREFLERLPVKVWKKVAPELFRYLSEKFDLIPQTISYFKKIHPKTFLDVCSKYFWQQLHSEAFLDIKAGRRFLTDREFIRLLSVIDADGLGDDLKYSLYDKFLEADCSLTGNYLKNKYSSVPLRDLGLRTMVCVLLCAPNRFQEFMHELTSDPAWGVRWAEQVLPRDELHFASVEKLLPNIPSTGLKDWYSWFNLQFPPEKAPYHEGVFTPGAKDDIYGFKSFVFKELMSRIEPETVFLLEELYRCFPNDKWFHDCALQVQAQVLAVQCPTFSADTIRKLLENPKRMRVISSADALLNVVMDSLARYQTFLTGANNPQVRFLWHEHKGIMTHRPEEDFSDHIQAFFSKDFRRIVSNREVRLNGGRNEQTGARTDIWIDAIADEMAMPLRLCIEVKGSWNKEVKTAYKTQLVGKYMDDGGADAGIFLVGWFESKQEAKKTRISKKENIAKLLKSQEQALVGLGHKVKHLIVDCSYSLPPPPAKKSRNTRKREE